MSLWTILVRIPLTLLMILVMLITPPRWQGSSPSRWMLSPFERQTSEHAASQGGVKGAGKQGCERLYWPVRLSSGKDASEVLSPAVIPEENWKKGHRGIDVAIDEGSQIIAPGKAVVVMSGKVGGKDVLSLALDNGLTVSIEPAISSEKKGATVQAGETIGKVEGSSDHCENTCAHIGVRRGNTYLNPTAALNPVRVVLLESRISS